MKTCDIIIPTYNNADTLVAALEAIAQQVIPPDWTLRVLVCDDGSTDDTSSVVTSAPVGVLVEYLPARHSGIAKARNRGIDASSADVLLFLGADIILRQGAVAAHMHFHDTHPEPKQAALGFVVWDPSLSPTPIMEWMTHGGPQNDFDALLGSSVVDATKFFFGSHVSVKRAFLGSDRFSDAYDGYGYEDIELGRQLAARGMELSAIPEAVGLHRHLYDVEAIARRQRSVGKNTSTFYGATSPEATVSLKHRLQIYVYLLGVGVLIKGCVHFLSSRYSCPRLFGHYVNYEYRRGVLHSEHMSSPQLYPQ